MILDVPGPRVYCILNRNQQMSAPAASPDLPRNVSIPARNCSALYHFRARAVGHVAAVANDLTTPWHAMGVDYGRRSEN